MLAEHGAAGDAVIWLAGDKGGKASFGSHPVRDGHAISFRVESDREALWWFGSAVKRRCDRSLCGRGRRGGEEAVEITEFEGFE
jgi:hypothetical protein